MEFIKAKLIKIKKVLVKYSLKLIAPVQILWVRYKRYDLHHIQIWYFWPMSNFTEVNNNLVNRLKTLRKR